MRKRKTARGSGRGCYVYEKRPGRFYAVLVRDGERRAHRCETRAEADKWLDGEIAKHVANHRELTMAEQMDARAALDILPDGVSLQEAARRYGAKLSTVIVSDAVAEYEAALRAAELRPKYQNEVARMLKRLVAAVGDKPMDAVTVDNLSAVLSGGPLSRNNWRRCFVGLWSWAAKAGRATLNPAAALPRARVDDRAPGILTPADAEAVLCAAAGTGGGRLLAYFALGMFAGIRSEEILRLSWGDVDLSRGRVVVGSSAAKTRRRRLVEIRAPLGEWLRECKDRTGAVVKVSPSTYIRERARIFKAAGVSYAHNAARHSYASYRLAETGDAGRTATELGHGDVDILYRHYREVVTPEDAALYFAILPGAKELRKKGDEKPPAVVNTDKAA